MSSDVEQQTLRCYQKIATALIEASPEHINHVAMRLENRHESVAVILEVSANPDDFFSPTDDLLMAVNNLGDLMRANNTMFNAADFAVFLTDEGGWKYSVEFEYEK